ncbi:GntR family transcriptional regulator [Leptolyngbya sp. FACHB-261]|uniref:GntR family transcriptional regulator n=1 Tax=Leptolyngbya sp. FACHB-261 TaxID=2692806 RepID=UPI001683BB8E|nr:GntR family transcriptional regulator [Leptolyngbya sp. FACHB-261]MBD2103432.1 GntR family transcriptional regulator [Leptolyngbya sp. FACHB-261]
MVQFHIQADSEIPASTQLFNQISFAIASRQFPPGHRLPSTRDLAMRTGLHRNTISKVYHQLEEQGLVEARAGSGIYVRSQDNTPSPGSTDQRYLLDNPNAYKTVQASLDQLLAQGCTLNQARELFLAEIDWRLRCSAQVLVCAPTSDIGTGDLMAQELQKSLDLPIQLVPLEELVQVLQQKTRAGTVVTSRYFLGSVQKLASPYAVRVFAVDIHDYAPELKRARALPPNSYLGMVCLSSGILRAAEVILHSVRGDDLLVVTANLDDSQKIRAIARSADLIICDPASYETVKTAVADARHDRIRPPEILPAKNYIDERSIELLKRELGF